MSYNVQQGLSRRQFLSAALATAGGALMLGPQSVLAGGEGDGRNDLIRWAFLSDTHVAGNPDDRYRGFYPYRNTREVAGQVADNLPEGVVITGDLSRLTGQASSYKNVKKLLAPVFERRPVYMTVGNHDHRGNFERAFAAGESNTHLVQGKYVTVVNAGPVRMIMLDSLLYVNWFPGMLGKTQRRWLQTYLNVCDDRPTILFLHHALSGGTDLLDAGKLLDIIRPVAKVKAVVFGHSHACAFTQTDGIHLVNLPAIGYNFRDSQPVGWVEARLTRGGGEFTVHAIGGSRMLDGHTSKLLWRA